MKKYLAIYLVSFLLITTFSPAFAAIDCTTLAANAGDDPDPRLVVCIVNRVINTLLGVLGVVILGVIIYGTIKMSMATGDVKRLAGARQTWFYGFLGACVVIGFFSFFLILQNIFGVNIFGTPGSLVDAFQLGVERMLDAAQITY